MLDEHMTKRWIIEENRRGLLQILDGNDARTTKERCGTESGQLHTANRTKKKRLRTRARTQMTERREKRTGGKDFFEKNEAK